MALSKRCLLLLLLLLLRASVSACWRASNSSWSSRSRAFRDSTNLAICGSMRQVSQPAKGSRVTSRRCKTAAVCVGGWLVVHLTKPFPLFLEFSPLDIQCLHTLAHTLPLSHALRLSSHEETLSSSQRVHAHRTGSRLHHGAAWHRQLILRYADRFFFVFFYRLRRAAAPTAPASRGARACPRGAKAAKRGKNRHVSATPNRPRPGNLAHFWPRPGNLVLQVIWSTFCQNVAEVICPSLLIFQVFWPSNSGPPGILALHFEKPGILAGCKTRAQVICPAVFGKPGNLPRIFWISPGNLT